MTAESSTPTAGPAPVARPRLTRSEDSKIWGVCGGLAAYFGLDTKLVRIAMVVLAIIGIGVPLYIVATAITPRAGGGPSWAEETLASERTAPLIGIALVAVAIALVVSDSSFGWGFGFLHNGAWWLVALAAGAALIWWDRKEHGPVDLTPRPAVATAGRPGTGSDPAEAPTAVAPVAKAPRRPSFFLPGLAALLLAGGIAGVLDAADVVDLPLDVAFAGAVLVLGVAAIVGATLKQRVGLLVLAGITLVPFAFAASVMDVKLSDGWGERSVRPLVASDLPHEYRIAAGDMKLDLTSLDLPAGTTTVRTHMGAGELHITVPAGVPVQVDGHADFGETHVLGGHNDGNSVDDDKTDRGWAKAKRRILVKYDVGFGEIWVQRAKGSAAKAAASTGKSQMTFGPPIVRG
jgi:phage shock protein PspC (stress-responsive transcriptional regulator)